MKNVFHVVIPARYASTRLPGKPLQIIAGKTMIQHVYERAQASEANSIVVATDDSRVVEAVKEFGGDVLMTSDQHQSGTDRVQEVCAAKQWSDDTVIVGVQGDEPLIPPAVINQVARNCMSNADVSMATLCEPIDSLEIFLNPNAVKVLMDDNHRALYFSRAPIPWPRNFYDAETQSISQLPALCFRHVGIYAYRAELLKHFVQWPVARLEDIEKLEQLRVLSHGHRIHVEQACEIVPAGVDTQEDLDRVREICSN